MKDYLYKVDYQKDEAEKLDWNSLDNDDYFARDEDWEDDVDKYVVTGEEDKNEYENEDDDNRDEDYLI